MDTKASVSYIHKANTSYQCEDCPFWIGPSRDMANLVGSGPMRCVLHGPDDVILDTASCNYFVKDDTQQLGYSPLGLLTKLESGYTENDAGFSCKRCVHFDKASWVCSEVDKDSPGDDPGQINPDACCNEWEADPVRSKMSQEAFYG